MPNPPSGGPLQARRGAAHADDASIDAGIASAASCAERIGSTGSCSGTGALVAQHMQGSAAGDRSSPQGCAPSAQGSSGQQAERSTSVQHSAAGATCTAQQDGEGEVGFRQRVDSDGARAPDAPPAQHGAPVPAIAAIWQQHSGIQNASSPAMMVRHERVTAQEYGMRLGGVERSRGVERISVLLHFRPCCRAIRWMRSGPRSSALRC